MGKLQWLLSTLSEAGVLPNGNAKVKPIIVIDENPPEPPENSPPKVPLTKNIPKDLNYAASELPPTLSKGSGPSRPGFGLNSFVVHAILPQSKSRPPLPERGSQVLKLATRARGRAI